MVSFQVCFETPAAVKKNEKKKKIWILLKKNVSSVWKSRETDSSHNGKEI